jgi:hypothetical protein
MSYLRRMQFNGVSNLKVMVIDADCPEDLEWEVILEKFIDHIPETGLGKRLRGRVQNEV